MATLNPYSMTWAIIVPSKGKITKKDVNILYRSGALSVSGSKINNEFHCWFATKEKAESVILKVSGLSKPYKVVFITDKQFGLSKWDESFLNVATKKQLRETKVIY